MTKEKLNQKQTEEVYGSCYEPFVDALPIDEGYVKEEIIGRRDEGSSLNFHRCSKCNQLIVQDGICPFCKTWQN